MSGVLQGLDEAGGALGGYVSSDLPARAEKPASCVERIEPPQITLTQHPKQVLISPLHLQSDLA